MVRMIHSGWMATTKMSFTKVDSGTDKEGLAPRRNLKKMEDVEATKQETLAGIRAKKKKRGERAAHYRSLTESDRKREAVNRRNASDAQNVQHLKELMLATEEMLDRVQTLANHQELGGHINGKDFSKGQGYLEYIGSMYAEAHEAITCEPRRFPETLDHLRKVGHVIEEKVGKAAGLLQLLSNRMKTEILNKLYRRNQPRSRPNFQHQERSDRFNMRRYESEDDGFTLKERLRPEEFKSEMENLHRKIEESDRRQVNEQDDFRTQMDEVLKAIGDIHVNVRTRNSSGQERPPHLLGNTQRGRNVTRMSEITKFAKDRNAHNSESTYDDSEDSDSDDEAEEQSA